MGATYTREYTVIIMQAVRLATNIFYHPHGNTDPDNRAIAGWTKSTKITAYLQQTCGARQSSVAGSDTTSQAGFTLMMMMITVHWVNIKRLS